MAASQERDRREFGHRVADIRARAGMSRPELAERSSLNVNYLQHLERGDAAPSPRTIRALAEGLGIAQSELMDGLGKLCVRERLPSGLRQKRGSDAG
jgi:transcriptional regulator with XRE-family HTH domain